MEKSLLRLLAKYNVPGPRYTSYPTVPAWTSEIGATDYKESLRFLKATEPLSLYFHIPFCERLCHFCGCMQVITRDHSKSRDYVKILLKEMEMIASHLPTEKGRVNQVHFGGGTPNFLQPEELSQIMKQVRQIFSLEDRSEVAIEMHPRTSTLEFCEKLKTEGFNRISLGIQDFSPKVQELIHRGQNYEMTAAMVSDRRPDVLGNAI